MAAGLQIWDANGVLVSDTTMRWGRFLGVVNIPKPTGNASGSVVDAGLSTGEPFWFCFGATGDWVIQPAISVSGNTLSWSFGFDQVGGISVAPVGAVSAITLIYGVR